MEPIVGLTQMLRFIKEESKVLNLEGLTTETIQDLLSYLRSHDKQYIISNVNSNPLLKPFCAWILQPVSEQKQTERLFKLENRLVKELQERKHYG